MLRLALVFLSTIFLLSSTLASAASQYHLDVHTHISGCWATCESDVTDTLNLPGRNTNSVTYVTKNCQFEDFLNLMSLCLAQTCRSAPDAAYAIEYGKNHCERAGVNANITLPAEYLEAGKEYFTSEAYTSKGTKGVGAWGMGGVILVLGTVIAAAF